MGKRAYTDRFFDEDNDSLKSANAIVPAVIDAASPASVIDMGCGRGEFLSVFIKEGITDVLGVDGDWVKRNSLKIPAENFISADLEKPFTLDRKFDLVMSLEVAEHLKEEFAGVFVDSLAGLGDVILFSAAVPFQGGRNHLNERWPEYWAKLFRWRGYAPVDCIRKKFWGDEDVRFWYAQNMLFFVKAEKLKDFPEGEDSPLSIVHPELYLKKCRKKKLFRL